AADELTARGYRVRILEARDRVGGRTLNAPIPGDSGTAVELGGQWVGPGQDRILTLLRELRLDTFPTYDSGRHLIELAGRLHRTRSTVPPLGPLALADIVASWQALRRAVRRVPTDAPWTPPPARHPDAETFASWLHRRCRTRAGRRFFHALTKAVFATEPEELSALWAHFYFASAGGLDPVLATTGGAQQNRILGGSQRIATSLAESLGERVETGAPVCEITHVGDRAVARTRSGTAVRARRVVVAVPPALVTRIDFDPPLPAARHCLLQRLPPR